MEKSFLFITDLDASLLEHDYTFDAALPSLDRIREINAPLILNSSKTLAELEKISTELDTKAPIIAENGSAIGFPEGSSVRNIGDSPDKHISIQGLHRDFILVQAHKLREKEGYLFRGFADWTAKNVTDITKLTAHDASLAIQRVATEPILWKDSEERFESFRTELAEHGINIIRGGKFIHLTGKADKADAAAHVISLYKEQYPDKEWQTVALGDSENDLKMLELADIACVIPHDGAIRIHPNNKHTIYATQNASAGWNECIQQILT